MNNDIMRFLWSRTYLLRVKGGSNYFFSPKMRNEGTIAFVLRKKNAPEEVIAPVSVPEGEHHEVAGPFEWKGQQVYLHANQYIARGLEGRQTPEGKQQLLVGDEWVDYGKHYEALNRMDEQFNK